MFEQFTENWGRRRFKGALPPRGGDGEGQLGPNHDTAGASEILSMSRLTYNWPVEQDL